MREEVFDELHVVGGGADQLARATPREIGGGERVELPEEIDPHVREQTERHVVREPGFEPVQDPGERRHDDEGDEQTAVRRAVLECLHDQGAEDPDADQRDHARDAEAEGH